MQDPGIYDQVKPQFPEHEHLKCPRCDSGNTKFCYYNNYNLSQPRHFFKNCRRYWTKGGTLRNIPVGSGRRKNTKRSSNSKCQANSVPDSEPARIQKQPDSFASSAQTLPPPGIQTSPLEPNPIMPYGLPGIIRSFSSLLSANEQFGNLLDGLKPNRSGLKTAEMCDFGRNLDAGRDLNADSGQDPRVERSNNGEKERRKEMEENWRRRCRGEEGEAFNFPKCKKW